MNLRIWYLYLMEINQRYRRVKMGSRCQNSITQIKEKKYLKELEK